MHVDQKPFYWKHGEGKENHLGNDGEVSNPTEDLPALRDGAQLCACLERGMCSL